MEKQRINLLEKGREVRSLLLQKRITYDQALEILTPVVQEANERALGIARSFGKRHKPFRAQALLR